MRLDQEDESRNIEDRRGFRVSRGVAGGGIGTLVIILLALFFGFDPSMLLPGQRARLNSPANTLATGSTAGSAGRDAAVRRARARQHRADVERDLQGSRPHL